VHELAIASSVLEAVQAEAARRPGARPVKVGLRVGELAGVDPEALSFSFEVLVQGTEFEPLELEIERCRRRQRCPLCRRTFPVVEYDLACPDCGATQTQCIAGDELELAYLEVEES
jgi:hydrogenase nickel incorporation protein HypA/HybF